MLEWMREWSYSMLLLLWWFPSSSGQSPILHQSTQHSTISSASFSDWCPILGWWVLCAPWGQPTGHPRMHSACSRPSDSVPTITGCPEVPFLLVFVDEVLGSWKRSQTEGSLLPQCFWGILCSPSPSTLQCKTNLWQRACGGQSPGLTTGVINRSLTSWVSTRCQMLCINYLIFIHSKSCDVSTF